MHRLLRSGLWVFGLVAVLAPSVLAQEGRSGEDWWKRATPAAVQEQIDRGADLK